MKKRDIIIRSITEAVITILLLTVIGFFLYSLEPCKIEVITHPESGDVSVEFNLRGK